MSSLRDPQRVQTDESVSLRVQRILGERFMELWDDPGVREVYVNSDGRVRVNRSGVGRQRTDLILDEVAIVRFLGAVAAYRKEMITPEKPSLRPRCRACDSTGLACRATSLHERRVPASPSASISRWFPLCRAT